MESLSQPRDEALVLLVGCDPSFISALEAALRRERLRSERTGHVEGIAGTLRRVQPAAVVLCCRSDHERSGERAIDVLKRIRAESDVPVLVLLRSGGAVSELLHFGLGADDVVRWPVSPLVVAARVVRLVQRAILQVERTSWTVGDLRVDRYQHCVLYRGRRLDLTALEYRLLAALAGAPGRAFSRSELIGEAMPESDALERSIDVHIWSLRRKLARAGGTGLLETVRGIGYRLASPALAEA